MTESFDPKLDPDPPSDTDSSNKILIIFLLIVSFISTSVAIYGVYQTSQLRNQITQLENTIVPEPIAPTEQTQPIEPTATEDIEPTADWETYTNEEYGFSFKYPNEYLLTDSELEINPENEFDSPNGIGLIKETQAEYPSHRISLNIVQTDKNKEDFLDYTYQIRLADWESFIEESETDYEQPAIISKEHVENPDIEALKFEQTLTPNRPNHEQTGYLIKKDNLLYILSLNHGTYDPETDGDGSNEKNTMDLIFPTFRFI